MFQIHPIKDKISIIDCLINRYSRISNGFCELCECSFLTSAYIIYRKIVIIRKYLHFCVFAVCNKIACCNLILYIPGSSFKIRFSNVIYRSKTVKNDKKCFDRNDSETIEFVKCLLCLVILHLVGNVFDTVFRLNKKHFE